MYINTTIKCLALKTVVESMLIKDKDITSYQFLMKQDRVLVN